MKNRLLIDGNTGQIIKQLNTGDRIVTSKQSDYKLRFNKDQYFFKLYGDSLDILCKKLTNGEKSFFLSILKYLDYDCVLRYEKTLLTTSSLAKLLEMSYDATRSMLSKLKAKKVLTTYRVHLSNEGNETKKSIVINPFVVFKGTNLGVDIYELFKSSEYA